MKRKLMRLAIVLLAGLALILLAAWPALAQPPNDNFADATVIDNLPFSDDVDNSTASLEDGEPVPSCMYWNDMNRTIWYAFTPGESGTFFSHIDVWWDTFRAVYTGSSLSELSELSCYTGNGTFQLDLNEGTTYYIQIGSVWPDYAGSFTFSLEQKLPPANDDLAGAIVIEELPFEHYVDTSTASLEVDEPTPSCTEPFGKSIWYAYTPTESGMISAHFSAGGPIAVAAYSGDASNLLEVGCSCCWGEWLTFQAEAGTTYYFQVGVLWTGGWSTFYLEVTPPPEVYFNFYPSYPSVFDTVQFYDSSWDPAGLGIVYQAWDLGDGTTAEGCCPSHQYPADGDYTVQLTVTTYDGRSASTSQTVSVRTHDVAITKFLAPSAARVGQTRPIVVGLNSKRYPEQVEVQLYKSIVGGYEWVGTLRQSVPVRPANRTTDFRFSYTFTAADATIGKVTFKALANLIDAWDVLPADNEAISTPTKVTR